MLDLNLNATKQVARIVEEPIETRSARKVWRRISVEDKNKTAKVRAMREVLDHITSYEERL